MKLAAQLSTKNIDFDQMKMTPHFQVPFVETALYLQRKIRKGFNGGAASRGLIRGVGHIRANYYSPRRNDQETRDAYDPVGSQPLYLLGIVR